MKYSVAKAIITVHDSGDHYYLMSLKRAPASSNDGKLEFLGGKVDNDESPRKALLRELAEEEPSGLLVRAAKRDAKMFFRTVISEALHHVYTFTIDVKKLDGILHCKDESYGHHLIAPQILTEDDQRFSEKTNGLLRTNQHTLLPAHQDVVTPRPETLLIASS